MFVRTDAAYSVVVVGAGVRGNTSPCECSLGRTAVCSRSSEAENPKGLQANTAEAGQVHLILSDEPRLNRLKTSGETFTYGSILG
jgi:hypothetical protein